MSCANTVSSISKKHFVRLAPRQSCKIPSTDPRPDSQALTLLTSLLTSGNSSNHLSAAFVPPSQHLALAATLAVHPSLTIRARSADLLQAANLALRYLRLVHQHVGPVNANFREAFAFTSAETSSRRGGSARRRAGEGASPVAQDAENVNTDLASIESLWARAEDFWHVVGWAFNCSVVNKRRWERWRVWLEYMLQVLEDDWNLRRNMADVENDDRREDPREESLIVQYLGPDGARTGKERRVVRAVFADGSPRALSEFKEIWRHETRERKPDSAATKKLETKVNVDEDIYGDYLKDDDSSDLEDAPSGTSPPSTPSSPSRTPTLPSGASPLGGPVALNLRLRLLSLLSTVSATLPSTSTPITTLYDLYLTQIRPLPLPSFSVLLSPTSLRHFAPSAASSLTQYILRSLISSAAPLPAKDDLTQEVLEQSYLPYAAHTSAVADNAKVGVCVEALVRLWNVHIGLLWSEGLRGAVEAGIEAREERAKTGGRGRRKGSEGQGGGGGGGDEDRVWLRLSAERLRGLVEMVRPP